MAQLRVAPLLRIDTATNVCSRRTMSVDWFSPVDSGENQLVLQLSCFMNRAP